MIACIGGVHATTIAVTVYAATDPRDVLGQPAAENAISRVKGPKKLPKR